AWFGVPTVLSALIVPPDVGQVSSTTRLVIAGLALPALGTVVLFWRRRAPVTVTGAMVAMGVLCLATVGSTGGFEFGIALALYAVAAASRPGLTWIVFSASMVLFNGAAWL